jgi:hypothetical protein
MYHVPRLVSVVKMAIVLEGVLQKSSILLCTFCRQKDTIQRIFMKKCFLFTATTVCSQWFTTCSRNSLNDIEVQTEVRKWLRKTYMHHAMKRDRGLEVYLHAFLNSTLDKGE